MEAAQDLSTLQRASLDRFTVAACAQTLDEPAVAVVGIQRVVLGQDNAEVVGGTALKKTCQMCHVNPIGYVSHPSATKRRSQGLNSDKPLKTKAFFNEVDEPYPRHWLRS